jgi:hypothetical protein
LTKFYSKKLTEVHRAVNTKMGFRVIAIRYNGKNVKSPLRCCPLRRPPPPRDLQFAGCRRHRSGLLPVGSPCWTSSHSQTTPSPYCRYRPSQMRRLNRPDRSTAGRCHCRSPTPPHQPSSASPPLNSTKKKSSSPDHGGRHHWVLKGVVFCSFHKTGLPTDLHFLLLPAPVTASLS